MATFSGYSGGVKIGEPEEQTLMAIVRKWELSDSSDLVDITGMDPVTPNPRKHWHAGLGDWTATVEGVVDDEDAHLIGTASPAAPPVVRAGAPCSLNLMINATVGYTDLTGYVKTVKPSLSVDGVLSFTLEIQGSGSLSFPSWV